MHARDHTHCCRRLSQSNCLPAPGHQCHPGGYIVRYPCKSAGVQQAVVCDEGEGMALDEGSHASPPSKPNSSCVSASRLSRLFFILGQVAIQHLVSQLRFVLLWTEVEVCGSP